MDRMVIIQIKTDADTMYINKLIQPVLEKIDNKQGITEYTIMEIPYEKPQGN